MAKNDSKPKDEQNDVQQAPADDQTPVNNQKPEDDPTPPNVPNEGRWQPSHLVVISARGLALREYPSKQAAMLAVLPTGTLLASREADENSKGWSAVQTKDGKAGYVDTRFVTVVD